MNRVGVELLHLPVERSFRAKLRALTEAGGTRAGQALASLFVLAVVAVDSRHPLLTWAPVALSGVWLTVALHLPRPPATPPVPRAGPDTTTPARTPM
jgi:ATP/ADP translocase